MKEVKKETGEIEIRVMTPDDLPAVAEAHMLAFPDSLITKLGKGASERYYRWQLEGPHSLYPIVAVLDGVIVGFCVGGVSRGSLRGYLKKYKYYLAMKVALHPSLFVNGNFFNRLKTALRSLFGKDRRPESAGPASERKSFGILAICVVPKVQGAGAAKEIMMCSEKEALKRGFEKMHLTVASDNLRAIKFYEKLGYAKKQIENNPGGTYMEKQLK